MTRANTKIRANTITRANTLTRANTTTRTPKHSYFQLSPASVSLFLFFLRLFVAPQAHFVYFVAWILQFHRIVFFLLQFKSLPGRSVQNWNSNSQIENYIRLRLNTASLDTIWIWSESIKIEENFLNILDCMHYGFTYLFDLANLN